jgi:hypothetical protein
VSGELIAANPEFRVVQPDGRRLRYWYQFMLNGATLKATGKCPEQVPWRISAYPDHIGRHPA